MPTVWLTLLFCAQSIPHSLCTKENARDVAFGAQTSSMVECELLAMETAASLAFKASPDEYTKLVCIRKE